MARIISVIPFLLIGLAGPAMAADVDSQDGAPGRRALKRRRLLRPLPPRRTPGNPSSSGQPASRYTVKRGDTLWGHFRTLPEKPVEVAGYLGGQQGSRQESAFNLSGRCDHPGSDLAATPRLRLEGMPGRRPVALVRV
jgi:hypothetical protein